jgi:hypothetical protein
VILVGDDVLEAVDAALEECGQVRRGPLGELDDADLCDGVAAGLPEVDHLCGHGHPLLGDVDGREVDLLIVASEVGTAGVGLVEVVVDDAPSRFFKRDFVVADEDSESVFNLVWRHVDTIRQLVVDVLSVLAYVRYTYGCSISASCLVGDAWRYSPSA